MAARTGSSTGLAFLWVGFAGQARDNALALAALEANAAGQAPTNHSSAMRYSTCSRPVMDTEPGERPGDRPLERLAAMRSERSVALAQIPPVSGGSWTSSISRSGYTPRPREWE